MTDNIERPRPPELNRRPRLQSFAVIALFAAWLLVEFSLAAKLTIGGSFTVFTALLAVALAPAGFWIIRLAPDNLDVGCVVFLLIPLCIAGLLAGAGIIARTPELAAMVRVNPLGVDQDREISAILELTPTTFSSGDPGTLVATFTNQGDEMANCGKVKLELPSGFQDGFVIVFPTSPEHVEVRNEKKLIAKPSIVFDSFALTPGQQQDIKVNLTAIDPGNYSGDLTIMCVGKIGKWAFERVFSTTEVNLSVVP